MVCRALLGFIKVLYLYVYTYIYMCVCLYMCMYVYIYIYYIYIYVYIHPYFIIIVVFVGFYLQLLLPSLQLILLLFSFYCIFIKLFKHHLIILSCLYEISIKNITVFNVLLSIVNSILFLGSGNYLLDLHDFMHFR